jgi:formylglycine-generating enzyme required for sulfatase activity
MSSLDLAREPAGEPLRASHRDMIFVAGGTYRMGSDKHYPEEAPVHRVTVEGFWIDRTPITNRQFKDFVKATGHVTTAEIPPDPKDYPGALPHMLYAGSLVFTPPRHPVDLRVWSQWWQFMKGANWRHPYGPKSNINGLDNHTVGYRSVGPKAPLGKEANWVPTDPSRKFELLFRIYGPKPEFFDKKTWTLPDVEKIAAQ